MESRNQLQKSEKLKCILYVYQTYELILNNKAFYGTST